MREKLNLTEEDGYEALRGHLAERAIAARAKHSDLATEAGLRRLLADPEVVRFPTALAFDASHLIPGEFAHAVPRGDSTADGFVLTVHPHFEGRPQDLPYLIAYHIPSINYLDVATHAEAELFGSLLLGLDQEAYYRRVCELADELGVVPGAEFLGETGPGQAPGGCGSGACGCAPM